MTPSQQRLQELFARYLQGHCEPQEVAELVALLATADEADALTEPMLRLWEELKTGDKTYPVNWERMYTRVSQTEDELSLFSRSRRRSRVRWRIAVAASVLVVVAAVSYWRLGEGGKGKGAAVEGRPAGVVAGRPGGTVAGPVVHVQVSHEDKKVVHLPDGSTVLLNKNSRLEYPPAFGDGAREVFLSGEAYFDITHVARRPFLVHTGKLTTQVLGTTFNIRAYAADKAIAITVTSGKVQVLRENVSMGVLTENQQIKYYLSPEAIQHQRVDVRPLVAWKPVEIGFDDITMAEAAKRIGELYGVTVRFANPAVGNCRVTASFYREDGLEEILTVLCGVNQSTYSIQDNHVLIDGRGCN
jgi:transmembrane sensor